MVEHVRRLDQYGIDLSEKIRPDVVRPPVEELAAQGPSTGRGSCRLAVRLHQYVADEIPYESEGPGWNRTVEETWSNGGNCVDQSVLLASMFVAGGLETRLVSLSRTDGRAHMLPEVRFEVDDNRTFVDTLYEATTAPGQATRLEFASERETDAPPDVRWFPADPEMSDHLGDLNALERQGYVDRSGDGWSWHKRVEVIYYDD